MNKYKTPLNIAINIIIITILAITMLGLGLVFMGAFMKEFMKEEKNNDESLNINFNSYNCKVIAKIDYNFKNPICHINFLEEEKRECICNDYMKIECRERIEKKYSIRDGTCYGVNLTEYGFRFRLK